MSQLYLSSPTYKQLFCTCSEDRSVTRVQLRLHACWAAALAAFLSSFSWFAFSLISFSLWISCLFSASQACNRLSYCSKSGFSAAARFCWASTRSPNPGGRQSPLYPESPAGSSAPGEAEKEEKGWRRQKVTSLHYLNNFVETSQSQ